jgi:hypothetical protein
MKEENRKNITIIGLIVLIPVITAVVYFASFEKYETTSASDLGQYKGTFYYSVALIPEKIDNSKVVDYKYIYEQSLLDDSQYIYLSYQYDDNSYQAEKERLSKIKDEYASVKYDEKHFKLPAYVYMFHEGDNNEYAIIDDEKMQITYVYVQCPFDFVEEKYVIQ